MRFLHWFAAIGLASAGFAQTSPALKAPMDQLIPWLLDEDQQLRGVPFSELIFDTTGRKVLPFEANKAVDQRVAKALSAAFTPPAVVTAVSARFISSRRSRRIKCAMTQCISWSDSSMLHAKFDQVLRTRRGNSRDGILSIFRDLPSD